MNADEEIIEFSSIDKWYGAFHALRSITFAVGKGERIVICGPSGSGKSSLLRCVNGLEPFQGGTLTVCGSVLRPDTEDFTEVRRHVGMVFQQFNLFPHMTALQNCTLAPVSAGRMGKAQAESAAADMLRRVKMLDHAAKFPAQLSGGQQQRVAIARALCMRPSVMLFDEPTSALDPEMVKEVLDTMISLVDEGMTAICVTHEMSFAQAFANRVVFMDDGQILEVAPPAELFRSPQHPRTRAFLSDVQHAAHR